MLPLEEDDDVDEPDDPEDAVEADAPEPDEPEDPDDPDDSALLPESEALPDSFEEEPFCPLCADPFFAAESAARLSVR